MPLIHRASLVIEVDYHQFYITDADEDWQAPEDWTDEDLEFGVKLSPNGVTIAPARNMYIPVEVEVFDLQPQIDIDDVDHALLCSMELQTGYLQIQECTGVERLLLTVPKGTYTALVSFSGLSTISDDGLYGDDRYKVVLWPSNPAPLKVLKQWHGEWRG